MHAEFARQRLEVVLRTQHLLQQVLEFLGAVGLAHEIAQLLAGLQQGRERGNLRDDPRRIEIVHRVELEVDGHLGAVVGELVVDLELEARRHAGHHVVEVVAVDLREFAVRQRLQRRRRVAREIAHDADDERQLALDLRAFGFDVVGDVHSGLAHTI